jgi:UDP-N-acetylglucosamine 2-epimerase (non-hydrolysing)
MACAVTAKKLCIPVAHVEAGLRSRDWSMPEEINRVVTDAISDLLFTPGILEVILDLSNQLRVVWPVHPRSRKNLEKMGLIDRTRNRSNLKLIDPVGYLDMLALNRFARVILTDSGGIQEEATVLGVACVTLRHNTERPVTVEVGANRVVGNEPKKNPRSAFTYFRTKRPSNPRPGLLGW